MSRVDCFSSITELLPALECGEISSVDLTRTSLERIENLNPGINCYLSIFADSAMKRASELDREANKRGRRGPLHGIPVAVKDIFDFPGHVASGGSLPLRPAEASGHASVIKRLEQAGAVLLGVLNLDELAAGGTGDNAHFGRCRNPWSPAHCSGGSSGGSAAAAAAGLAFATIGSDAGGSTRIPAAFCGVAGLKPTYGRVSRAGALARTWSMDCIGPLARSADDLALVFNAILGHDPEDPTSVANDSLGLSVPIDSKDRRYTIGLVDALVDGRQADPNLAHSLALLEEDGHALKSADIADLDRSTELQQILVKSEGAAMHRAALTDPDSSMSHSVRSVIKGGLDIPAWRYIEALSQRDARLASFITCSMADFDALALPVSLPVAPPFESSDDWQSRDIDAAFSATAVLTRFANYLGVPAVSVPTGLDANGLPTAIQFVGRPFGEARLLQIAARLEQLRGPLAWPEPRPG